MSDQPEPSRMDPFADLPLSERILARSQDIALRTAQLYRVVASESRGEGWEMGEDALTMAERRALAWLGLVSVQDLTKACACPVCEWLRGQRTADPVGLGQGDRAVKAEAECERLRQAYAGEMHEIDQILGIAAGCPIYGPEMFEDGIPNGDVCTGEHTPASLAMEVAAQLVAARAESGRLRGLMRQAGMTEADITGEGA